MRRRTPNESPQKAKNDDNPEGVAKKIKKVHFFAWQFGVYLHNSYFLVSKPLSRAFLCISQKSSNFAADFEKQPTKL